MRVNEKMRKVLSIVLTLCMVLSYIPAPAYAVGADCTHHTEHTAECGYVPAVEGVPCTHVHSESCYKALNCQRSDAHECTVESGCIVMEKDCHHTHGDCGYSEGTAEVPCGHVHDENCSYVAADQGTACGHSCADHGCTLNEDGTYTCLHAEHDEVCGYVEGVEGVACGHTDHTDCGYAPATEGTPCTHVCEVKVNSSESCYKLLCSHKDGGHDEVCGYVAAVVGHECHFECPDCAAALVSGHQPEQGVEMDEAIKSLQELIDALPDADEITQENRENVISLMEAIDAEKAELTDAQREMVDFSKFAAVAAVLSGGVSDAVMPINLQCVYLDSETGDDSYSGAVSNSPVKTFSRALELVAGGGTIVLGEDGVSIEDPQFIIDKDITISSDEGSTLQAYDLTLAANVTFYNSKLFCTDLTIQSGVTLDLSKLTVGDIIFTIGDDQTTSLAMAVNNGAIKFPADFSLNDAPKSGTVYIGEKNYVWNNDRWNCGSDSAHTTQKPENKGTCKKKAVCDLCGTEYGDPDPDAHTLTHVEAVVPANCQKTGHDEYWYCDGCETCFGDAEASYWVEISWISYTGNHVRPVGAAPCAVVPCALCGEDTYGDDECDRGDTPKCQDAVCINCGETVPGWGCNYNSGDEEEFLPLCLPGDCVYCGKHYEYLYEHENNSWKPCIEPGECVYECGMQFPATGEHNLAEPCAGGVCTYCWNEVGPQHSYDNIPNDDGLTHSVVCSGCGTEVTENHSTEKEENKANCQQGDICDLCGTEYGEVGGHSFDENGKCTVCGADCTHENFTDGKCDDCGITGGDCGDVIWTYDEVTKAFAITGTGAMEDYNSYSDRPWDGSISENATSVTISEGVTRIGERAFQNFTQITAVTVPASVESIGHCAFTGCKAMQSITFAEGSRLTAFDYFVFQNCTALKQITLPAGVTSVDRSVFSRCDALTDIFVEEGSTTLKDIDGVLYTADGTTLLRYPFGKDDTAFTTPTGVTTIGEGAFEENVNLETITLSEGVTTIGEEAFWLMESLTTVTIPSSVTSIAYAAFESCDNLTTINAPCNWDTENPLYTFDSTVAVIVGDHTPNADGYTVNENGTHSFACSVCRMDAAESHSTEKEENKATCNRGKICDLCGTEYGEPPGGHSFDESGKCTACGILGGYCGSNENEGGRESLWWYFQDGTLTISGAGDMAERMYADESGWSNMSDSITALVIDKGVTGISSDAFMLLSNLEQVTFAEDSLLTTIGENAFDGCSSLKEITIPASVSDIDGNPFPGCTAMETIHVAPGNTVYKDIEGVLYTIDGTTLMSYPYRKVSYTFITPKGVTTIGDGAFAGTQLSELELTNDLTTVGAAAFYNCTQLREITISNSVKAIDVTAFYLCEELYNVYLPCSWRENPLYVFEGVSESDLHIAPHDLSSVVPSEDGLTHKQVCSACDYVERDNVPHSTTAEGDKAATCQNKAYCSVCKSEYGELADHTPDENTANGNVITVSCSVCHGTVGTATITAENTTYNGTAQNTAAVAYSAGWKGGELTVSYVNNVNAGTATASITIGEATASVEFTIAKAEIDGSTLINPEFAKGLIYNGTAQALVTKTGSVDGGYIVYSLSIDGEYTTTIPVATEAGTYRVYWTIECDENHYVDGTPGSTSVTIAKANPEYTVPTGLTATYGDTLAKVELPTGWAWNDAESTSVGNAGTRTFKALYNPDSNNYNTVEADVTIEVAKADPEYTVPTGLTATYGDTLADVELPTGWAWKDAESTSVGNAGTRTFKALYNPDSNNYNTVEADITVEVAKALIDIYTDNLINPEFAEGLIYNGTAQALVTNSGSIDGGYIVFSLNPDGEYTTEIPVATEAGEYVVYYRIEGDENHYWEGSSAFEAVTIAAKDASNATVTLDDTSVPFDGTAKTPGVTSVIVDGKTLNAETDYEVSYRDNTYVGTATVTITFKGNYTGNARSATFTIVRAAAPAIQWPTAGSLAYGQKLSESTLTSEDANGTFAWENGEQIPTVTNSGYVVVYTPKDTVNYDYSGVTLTQTIPVTVSKAPASVETAPAANTLIYTGEAQALVTAGAANNGEMQYSTDNQTWSTTIPAGTNAGDYTVYYKVVGDANHIDTDVQSVVVKIGQLAVAEPTVSGTYTYTGKEQMVTLTGVESYMTVVSGNKAVGAGSYEAVITLDGNHKWADGSDGKVQWSIGKAQAEIAVNTDPITAVYGGTVKLPEATANFGTVTCDTTADKLVNAGTYTVTYTVASTANFDGDSKTVTVTVNPKAITEADVSLNGSLVYTGSELTQAVTVTAGVTYEVTGNKATDVGTYELTVKATGNYTGEVSLTWSIKAAETAVVTAPRANTLTYTGAAQALVTEGTAKGGKLVYGLTENGTYAETVPTAKNAGSYTVWYYVQGDDNHTDSAKASVKVTIAKAKAEISVNTTPIAVTYGEAVMLPTATSSFGTVSCDKTAAELVNAGTYTVTYTVEGTANYEGDSKNVAVTIEKLAVAEPTVTETYVYTGSEQTVTLTGVESYMTVASGNKATNAGSYEVVINLDNNHKWADGSDGKVQWNIAKAKTEITVDTKPITAVYGETVKLPTASTNFGTVSCDKTADDLVNAGTYTVTYSVAGTNNYDEDTKTITVTVEKLAVAEPTVTGTYTYTGKEQTVTLTGVESYMTIASGNKAVGAGSYEVVITLDSNHKWVGGSDGKVQWRIGKSQAEITVNTDPITVTYGESVELPAAVTNFGTVTCDKVASDLVNAGIYTVTYSVVSTDNYDGDTKTITVTVKAKVVNQPVIEGIEAVYVQNGNAIAPVPTAVKDGTTVIDPSEYTLAYENNTAAGTATVKIVDKDGGNYTVNGSMTFRIVEHEHTWTYTTDSKASKIIATCSNADGHCPNTNGGSVSIQNPDELTYDGSSKDAEPVYESWQPDEITITYNNVDRVNVTGKEIVASIGVVGAGIQSVYTIVPAALPNATLSADSGIYTGQAHTVTVELGTLVKDTDYTVTIPEDMTNAGTKTITVTGKGNYEGTQNLTYTIAKSSDVAAPAPGIGYTIDYAKETITITDGFEVIDSDGKAVVSGNAANYFGMTLKVRYAETQNTEPSAYTGFTLAERPAVPNVTIHNETIKGKADGKITGLDATMEYSTDGGKHWIRVETTDASEKNLTVGTTIAVRMKATQTAPCSESKTGTVAAGTAITVTYAQNGQAANGMPAQIRNLSYGNKLTKPADPTAKDTDFAFRGWYKDAECTVAWDFEKDTVTEETVTIYAKWEQVYFSVTAEIQDHTGEEYQGQVQVKLMRGDSQIDSVTGMEGSFRFSCHVEAGMYNLVAVYTDSRGEHTKTELITVDHDESFVLKLPAPGVNSHLTVGDNVQTPDVMVGELDAEAESVKQQTGAIKVEIEMTVTTKTESQVSNTVVTAVEAATNHATVEYLDITVTKQIDDGAKTEMSETTNLMEIVIPYNTSGKTNLRVFRHHGGQLQEFAQGSGADRTFYYANGYIHIFTRCFSNYMISYEVSRTVTFDANGGTVGIGSLTTQTNGTLSALPIPTRAHYVFKGWYTAKSGGTKVTTDTVFNGDATIYAQWGGYAITVADAKNGTVTVNRIEAPGTTEITITVTPKTGYKMSTLTVKDAAGKYYVISTDNNSKYYFAMPDADVTVKVTFSKISTSTADPSNPKTGDDFHIAVWSCLMLVSGLGVVVLLAEEKKRRIVK